MSLNADNYAATVGQPAYNYYHMQPAYDVDK